MRYLAVYFLVLCAAAFVIASVRELAPTKPAAAYGLGLAVVVFALAIDLMVDQVVERLKK
jgi:hypothetical protein